MVLYEINTLDVVNWLSLYGRKIEASNIGDFLPDDEILICNLGTSLWVITTLEEKALAFATPDVSFYRAKIADVRNFTGIFEKTY